MSCTNIPPIHTISGMLFTSRQNAYHHAYIYMTIHHTYTRDIATTHPHIHTFPIHTNVVENHFRMHKLKWVSIEFFWDRPDMEWDLGLQVKSTFVHALGRLTTHSCVRIHAYTCRPLYTYYILFTSVTQMWYNIRICIYPHLLFGPLRAHSKYFTSYFAITHDSLNQVSHSTAP